MFAFFKKFIVVIVVGAAIVGVIIRNSFQTSEKNSTNTLVVGLQSGYPPFEFMDTNGKIVGFDLDLAARIAEKLGKKLVIQEMSFEGTILSLKQGKMDLIMSGMSITPSRLKQINMVPYHGETATILTLIFWKEIPEGVHSLQDVALLPNHTVSVQSGTVSEMYISRYKGIDVKSFQEELSALIDVKYGKSIANLVEPDVASYLKKEHPEIQTIRVPVTNEDTITGFGIGVKKENQELFQQVQEVIQELRVSGELKQLADKWFKGKENI